jgi:hypothetical protein
VVNAARAARNPVLLDTIAHDSDRMDLAGQAARSPLALQQSNITDLNAAGNAGQLTPGHYQLITDLQRKYNAISKGLDENPIATTVSNFPDKVKDPGPLDYSSPENLAAGLKARSKVAQFAAQNWQTAPLAVLDQQDVKQVQAALQSPAGPAVLAGLGSGLQPAELGTLFDKTKLGDAITGMSRSGDPAKMNAAYSFMDTQQRQNPLQFSRQFPDGLRDLRAWQSLTAFNTPDATAKKMETFFSPQEAEARKVSDTAANDVLSKVSPASVVSKFSTGWFGTTANAPAGDFVGASGALKTDYDDNFRDGFAISANANMADSYAIEKLKQKYSVSPTNGNRVTAFAPESYYPMVGGSYDWMAKQLDDTITKMTGVDNSGRRTHLNVNELKQLQGKAPTVDQSPLAPFAQGASDTAAVRGQRMYAAPRSLVSDETTAADVSKNRPPSYQVIIQDPNGRWGLLTDPISGAAHRVYFDPAQPFAERAARFSPISEVMRSPANSTMAMP